MTRSLVKCFQRRNCRCACGGHAICSGSIAWFGVDDFHRMGGDRAIVRTKGSVRLDDFSEPEPDVLLLRLRSDYCAHGAAEPSDVLLLIEVSQSSLRYDSEAKPPLYARVGNSEVWIIDLAGRRLNRHAAPVSGRWTVEDSLVTVDAIEPRELIDATLDVLTLFGHARQQKRETCASRAQGRATR